jgi:hypothetical protein
VTNELVVGPETLIAARTRDTYITSKVKARLVERNAGTRRTSSSSPSAVVVT